MFHLTTQKMSLPGQDIDFIEIYKTVRQFSLR